MKLSRENGFDFNGLIRLDDKSIKALYPGVKYQNTRRSRSMTKLEIACVVCGLIGILIYQPIHIEFRKGNIAILLVMFIIKDLCFTTMIILPLYFRLWR